MTISGSLKDIFKQFLASTEFKEILLLFAELRKRLQLSPGDHLLVYKTLRQELGTETTHLWKCLDKRKTNVEYGDGLICKDASVSYLLSIEVTNFVKIVNGGL